MVGVGWWWGGGSMVGFGARYGNFDIDLDQFPVHFQALRHPTCTVCYAPRLYGMPMFPGMLMSCLSDADWCLQSDVFPFSFFPLGGGLFHTPRSGSRKPSLTRSRTSRPSGRKPTTDSFLSLTVSLSLSPSLTLTLTLTLSLSLSHYSSPSERTF